MKRRQTLLLLAMAVTVLKFLPTSISLGKSKRRFDDTEAQARISERLATLFTEPARAEALGQSYLSETHQDMSWHRLFMRVSADLGANPLFMSDREIQNAFDGRYQQDLVDHKVRIVDGWVLADCEVNVCGLLALGRMIRQ